MKYMDFYLQRRRIAVARSYVPNGATLLDIGSADGVLFETLSTHILRGIGIDPDITEQVTIGNYTLMHGTVPDTQFPAASFDCITMLAVLEHIPRDAQQQLVEYCSACLKPGGRVIITVPSPLVDAILVVLQWLRVIDAMSLHQHYGFLPSETHALFCAPHFRLIRHQRFQLGLNNLFVFEKC
jgi:2-polyprenyl-3-methyl-5-hydroxy-6-metoxy-1,4-benzoquinol methylase